LTGILLAVAASLSWGVADFGAGVGSRRLAVPLVIAASQAAGLVFIALVVAILPSRPADRRAVRVGALAGVVGVMGLTAFYRGLAIGAMGIVGPLSATGAVVPLAYGLTRGERPATLQLAGVALAVVGVIAASVERHVDTHGRRIGAGVGYALLAALGFGCSLIALSKAAAGGALWAPLSMRSVGVPLIVTAVLLLRTSTEGLRAIGVAARGRRRLRHGRPTCSSGSRRREGCSASSRCSRRSIPSCSSRSRACCCTSGSRSTSSPAWRSRSAASP